MRVTLLKHTIKAPTEYSYAYILITHQFNIDDILTARANGKKIVFFGSTPESYMQWTILQEHGITPDYVCDTYCEYSFSNHGVQMRPYWELLEEPNKYYFIITIAKRINIPGVMKMLFYAGIDEFGIVYSEWSKDFKSSYTEILQNAFYDSINEVFINEPLFCNFAKLENLRRTALEGAGFWDVLYMSIYKLCRKKQNVRYLEIGAGTGIMSFSLAKLLGDKIKLEWIDVPATEHYWSENSTPHFKSLMEKYAVKQHLGYIEQDDFPSFVREKYDCIVLAQVMEHFIYNPVPTFKKLSMMLKEQGCIYVAVPFDHRFYNVRSWKEMPSPEDLTEKQRIRCNRINGYGHFHEYSYEQATEVFEASGLEVLYYRWNSPIHFFILRKKLLPEN